MKLRKVFYFFLVFAVIFSLSAPLVYSASKKEAGQSKVGIFDMQRIIKESKAGQKARATLEKELSERRTVLASKEEELRKFQKELEGNKDLESAERREKERKLAKELKELRRLRADLEEEMKDIDEELTIKLLKDVAKIVKAIGEKENFSVVFQKSPNMVYIDETIDVTSEILEKYNAQFKD